MKSAWAYFQKALYEKLIADATLVSLVGGRIGDWLDPEPDLPIVVIGDDVLRPWETKSEGGIEIDTTIHIYSDYRGGYQGKQIADRIIEVLTDNDLTLDAASGYSHVASSHLSANTETTITKEMEGQYNHIQVRMTYKLTEVNV